MTVQDDYALALQLQEQFDREAAETGVIMPKTRPSSGDNMDRGRLSLVDQRWEFLDPNPDIRALFLEFNDKYFWGKTCWNRSEMESKDDTVLLYLLV